MDRLVIGAQRVLPLSSRHLETAPRGSVMDAPALRRSIPGKGAPSGTLHTSHRSRHVSLCVRAHLNYFLIDLYNPPAGKTCRHIQLPLREVVVELLDGTSAPRFNALSVPSAAAHGHNNLLLQASF
jgi:hypothetical protein